MNASIDSADFLNGAVVARIADNAPRLYAGSPFTAAPGDYAVLLPAEGAWPRETVLRAVVADALQRNGKVVDEDTLDATVATVATPERPFAADALTWKLQPGETGRHGPPQPPFHGYAVPMPAALQQSLVAYAGDWAARRDATPPQSLDPSIAQLRTLALGHGAADVAHTLEAIEAAIRAGQAASASGQPLDAVALRSVLEFATRMGKEREAARILERYTALKGVANDAKAIGQDAERVFNGRDPLTGKPLNTDQRVESAFGLIGNGFKLVGDLGAAAQLLGVGGRFASTLIGIAPAGIAIVGFAAGVYGLIKKAREAILEPQWDEFRTRFPGAEGMEPKQFLKSAMRQIAGMPVDENNAPSTAARVLDVLGQNPETRERFLAFLRQKGESDALVDALGSGRFDGLSRQQAAELARASKGFAREFLEQEIDDTKRYVKDRDGDRTRGTYLLAGGARTEAERSGNKLGGTLDEAMRIGGILIGGTREFDAMLRDMLGKVKGVDLSGKPLSDAQQGNLAGATVAAAAAAGLTRVDHLLPSRDGSKLFAVQGDPQSETRRVATIDIATGAGQSVEASSRLAASPPVLAQQPPQEQAQRAM
jgi:hypothetical protein